jgi:excisionase family DNA binding protein
MSAGFGYWEDDMAHTGVLTLRQVATRLDVSDRAVLEMLSAGTIKGQKVGSEWRFRTEDVEAYVNSQAEQKESPRNSG